MQPISKGTFLGSLIVLYILAMGLSTTAGVMMLMNPPPQPQPGRPVDPNEVFAAMGPAMGLNCGGLLITVVVIVVHMVLVYKLWKSIQDPEFPPRTTPGYAVGLLFVPFYNFYWLFQVYWGWAVDYNRLAESRGENLPRMPEGLGLTYCILSLSAILPVCIPGVGFWGTTMIGLISFIILMIFFSQAIDGANALITGSAGGFDGERDREDWNEG